MNRRLHLAPSQSPLARYAVGNIAPVIMMLLGLMSRCTSPGRGKPPVRRVWENRSARLHRPTRAGLKTSEVVSEVVGERAAVDVLHHDVMHVLIMPDIVDTDHMQVIDFGRSLRLFPKASNRRVRHLVSRQILMARKSPTRTCSPRYTIPIPPRPSSADTTVSQYLSDFDQLPLRHVRR